MSNLTGDVSNLKGDVSNLKGDVSNLKGDVSNLKGNVSYLKGNVDEAEISDEERKSVINISDLDCRVNPKEKRLDVLGRFLPRLTGVQCTCLSPPRRRW